jgi:hypothetical protein
MHPSDLEKSLRVFVAASRDLVDAEKELSRTKSTWETARTFWERTRDELKQTVGPNHPEKFFSVDGNLVHVEWTRGADQKVDVTVRLVEVETK